MNIGEVAHSSGVSAKMIRHYESIGLIRETSRTLAGYRQYQSRDVHLLRFVRRARDLGFSLEQIRKLLSLWDDPKRASADVKRLAQTHIAELDARIVALTDMRDTLVALSKGCHGDHRPDCPILHGLAES
ncbi:MAG: Cu(I)-responsive transcriptional regulator [Sulfuriferula multivorans]|uniref:Cu(I)-responsive transcriptional regulator n=1 Tax=Sulfuriferula multivorans TaxID=1559896 RepID=A0A7C9P901_9PROT|nr:Cu(I)-responsive transcriptional regulator [Sulfuriferula multivorans]